MGKDEPDEWKNTCQVIYSKLKNQDCQILR